MPISSYPRPGHPIAPSLLAPFLRKKAPKVGIRFSELDATAWKRFEEVKCRKLGCLLIEHLASQVDDIKTLVGSQSISPVAANVTLEQLDIEVRTFNCLDRINIDAQPGGLANLTVENALRIHGFGIKSLVDLLTSVEASMRIRSYAAARPENHSQSSHSVAPKGCCDVIRRSGFVPVSLADLHVPTPPRGVKLEQLGLRRRTFNALKDAGYRRNPRKLGELTLRQAIQLSNFGAESLCDLIEAIERIEHTRYPLFYGLAAKRDECRILLDLIREKKPTPESVLTSNIPPLPPGIQFVDLCVQRRTRNILVRERIDRNLSRLAEMTVGGLIDLRGFGKVCIVDLLENVCRIREAAGYVAHGETSVVREVVTAIDEICSVPGISHVDQSDPRLGRLLRNVDASIPTIGNLAQCSERLSMLCRSEALNDLRKAVQKCAQQTIETELVDLIISSHAQPRNKRLVEEYYGFYGQPLVTLQVIGDKYKVSRERIRQICAPTKIVKLPRSPFAPAIDSALSLIRDNMPAPSSILEEQLVEQRIIKEGTTLHSVKRVALFLRREVEFEFIGSEASSLILPTVQIGYLKQVEQTARKLVSKLGAAVIDDVLERCEITLPEDRARQLVTIAVGSLDGFRWLDQAAGWFWFESGQYTRLRPRIRKVLAVCGEIDVGELRAAIRRDHRLQGRVPPKKILLELCRQMSEVGVDGDRVFARPPEDPLTLLKGDEARLVGLLIKHGPVCQREALQVKAMDIGMGIPSFWRCLQFSPTISRYAQGVYGLTGAKVTPSMIESLIKRRPVGRVIQEHGWTDDGRIWIVYRVSSASLDSGVIGVPAAKRHLIQGEFQLESERGQAVGTLNVKESAVWGFRSFLHRSGTEANDFLLIIFDTAKRTATARIGDAGLIDAFQEAA
jgi:hypothetical protein